MVIIMYGNPVEGFKFTGPFPDHDAAAAWDARTGGGDGFIVTLARPIGDEVELPEGDYTVNEAVWLTVGGWSCRVSRVGESGVRAAFFPEYEEDRAPIEVVEL
jgi:hypothetical protein